jgi:hypothetical protein
LLEEDLIALLDELFFTEELDFATTLEEELRFIEELDLTTTLDE